MLPSRNGYNNPYAQKLVLVSLIVPLGSPCGKDAGGCTQPTVVISSTAVIKMDSACATSEVASEI
jgi:hypothetical protein